MAKGRSPGGSARVFHSADYPVKLRIPEGTRFVEPTNKNDFKPALEAGLAVFARSCDGRAFVWREGAVFLGDHFFLGPPTYHEFPTIEEAAAFAAGLCE